MRPPRLPSLRATARYSTAQSRLRPARRTLARLHLRRIHALGWGGAARHHRLPSVRAPHARLLSRQAHRPPPRRAPDPSSPAAARRGPVPISYAPLQLRPPHRGVPLGSATDSTASAVPLGFHRGRRAPRTRAACLSAPSPASTVRRASPPRLARRRPVSPACRAFSALERFVTYELLRPRPSCGSTRGSSSPPRRSAPARDLRRRLHVSVVLLSKRTTEARVLAAGAPNGGSPLNRDTKDLRGFQWPSRPP
ncbi:hypothetical protein PVAP13_8KG271700 [Panicum virgatum]|uniref:Uncharacterized protein n=1 Tax=Panicum virgatum TaxID=38727 RepID=A0A8T0PX79_PANVG|nr:hypothetical protein PVAP13_8KG271700 [Panicum virgatum]